MDVVLSNVLCEIQADKVYPTARF